jgi:hypothetical protein
MIIPDSEINHYKYMSRTFLVGFPAHIQQIQQIKFLLIPYPHSGASMRNSKG